MVPEGPQQRPERVALLATLARRIDLARAVARLHLAVPAEQPEARVDRLGVVAVDRLVVEARHRDERGEEGAKAAEDGAARDRVEAVDLIVGEDGALGVALHEDAADSDEDLRAARRPAAELQRRVAAPLARLLLRREAVVLARAPQVLPRRRGPRQPLADLVLNLLHDAPPDKAAESRADGMPIGLVPPSGLRSPTRKQSPRRGRRLSWIRPAAILKKRRKRTSLARFDEWYTRPSSSYESASPENMARSFGTRAITL